MCAVDLVFRVHVRDNDDVRQKTWVSFGSGLQREQDTVCVCIYCIHWAIRLRESDEEMAKADGERVHYRFFNFQR